MRTIKLNFTIALMAALFVGCSSDETESVDNNTREALIVTSGIGITEEVKPFTRTAFDGNKELKIIVRDNVGKFLVPGDQEIKATTVSEQNSSGKNELTCEPKKYWDDLGGTSADLNLYGIYPYSATPTPPTDPTPDIITWDITGNNGTSYPKAEELLFAQKTNYTLAAQKIVKTDLNFNHVLAKITVKVMANEDDGFKFDDLDAKATVTFKNIPLKGDYSITDNGCDLKEYPRAATLTPYKEQDTNEKFLTYTVLCAPHANTGAELATINFKNNNYTVKIPYGTGTGQLEKFVRGKNTVITVNFKPAGVSATASLVDWDDIEKEINGGIITFEDFEIKDATGKSVLQDGSIINMKFIDNGSKVHKGVYTYSSSGSKWESTTPVYWDDIDTSITEVEALLVVRPAANNKTGEDYFYGKLTKTFSKADAIAGNSSINLDKDAGGNTKAFFYHRLSKVDITIKTSDASSPNGGEDKIKLAGIGVVIKGKVNYKEANETIVTSLIQDTDTEDIPVTDADGNATAADTNNKYVCKTAYIWPQELEKLCEVTTTDGNVYNVKTTTDGSKYKFEAGKHYEFTVTITKTRVTFTASLQDWGKVTVPGINTEL